MQAPQLTTRPTRRLSGLDVQLPLDEHGFLDPQIALQLPTLESLFDAEAVLVVGPPWSGKTHEATHLAHALNEDRSLFGDYHTATFFEQCGVMMDIKPPWWESWKDRDDQRACWVVDALDEDNRNYQHMHRILDLVEELSLETRSRLLLLMFVRENERPPKVIKRLDKIYGAPRQREQDGVQVIRLAPVCARIAHQITGSDEAFDRVCQLIKRNGLQAVASLPVVLQRLVRQEAEATVALKDLWQQVLKWILQDRRREKEEPAEFRPIDDRFRAACRIAAALTFSDAVEIDPGGGDSLGPSVPDLFPVNMPRGDQLRRAAWDVVKSAAFTRTATGYRFAQWHVQEWLTALEISAIPLNRLRPLVSDGGGTPFPEFRGALGLLHGVTEHAGVRDWIIESHGGIAPRSDAAPWTLAEAVRAMDRLQAIVRTTEFGLAFWEDRGLSQLAAPGLGDVLAQRIKDKSITLPERELLIDVAQAVGAKNTVAVAKSIILDSDEDDHLRLSASYLLRQVGSDDDIRELQAFVENGIQPSNRHQADMASALMEDLYDRRIWTFAKAVEHLPNSFDDVTGTTEMLRYRLQEDMTIDDARVLLRKTDWQAVSAPRLQKRPRTSRRHRARDKMALVVKALALIADQERPQKQDYALLIPIVIKEDEIQENLGDIFDWPRNLAAVIAKDPEARRNLFLAGMQQDPTGRKGFLRWRWVLQDEDLPWLANVCEQRGLSSPWLWEDLLRLAYNDSVAQADRNKIRKRLREVVPDKLNTFDRSRRKYRAQVIRHEAAKKRRDEQRETQQYALDEIVKDTLGSPQIEPHEQLVRLSWFCFVESGFRPTNVIGEWDDLDGELQAEVLTICERALVSTEPTAIPEGSSFPSAVLYEATAFSWVVQHSASYILDRCQIKKWLQSIFRMSSPSQETVLVRCRNADRAATEGVILKELQRQMQSDEGSVFVAENLPAEFWSKDLTQQAIKMLTDEPLSLKARINLIEVLARRAPSETRAIAEAWAFMRDDGKEATRALRDAGLNALLTDAPSKAIPQLVERCGREGAGLVLRMSSIADHHHRPEAVVGSWSSPLLEQLADLLHDVFPPETDPVREAGAYWVGRDDEFREMRGQIPVILLKRGTPEDHAALRRLAERYPGVRRWYDYTQSQQAAQTVLTHITVPDGSITALSTMLPVAKVVRLLDDGIYRLIRSDEDLQRVLVEEIYEITSNAKDHLSMLYRPPETSGKGKSASRVQQQHRRLHEDALQAYVFCRLNDRLAGRVLDGATVVFINREPLASKDQRLDIKVQAPTVDGRPVAVIIELKWSDNPDVSTSLVEQLGEEYLLGQKLTHGIYLVGWGEKGRWRLRAQGRRPRSPYTPENWLAALWSQVEDYRNTRPALKIVPMIMDLQWQKRASG